MNVLDLSQSQQTQMISLALIDFFPLNRPVTPEMVQDMKGSIQAIGMQNPLTTREMPGGRQQCLSGETRLRALRELGVKEAPCFVLKLNDEEALVKNFSDNLVSSLNWVDRGLYAEKYLKLNPGMTQETVAKAMK